MFSRGTNECACTTADQQHLKNKMMEIGAKLINNQALKIFFFFSR